MYITNTKIDSNPLWSFAEETCGWKGGHNFISNRLRCARFEKNEQQLRAG